MVENFCVARRLVEAGARFVSLNFSRWDWHGSDGMNFPKCREECPRLDQGLAALVTDLHERGLSEDVSIVVWGIRPHSQNQRQQQPRSLAPG
ncbi:MAG UNVERIFIED_CONTAM: DUF1501 domain-containing protein [Planctomycetaceae bacterium]